MPAVDNHLRRAQPVAHTLSATETLAKHDFARLHHDAHSAIALAGLGTTVVLRDEAGRQILNTAIDYGELLQARAAPEQVQEVFVIGKLTFSQISNSTGFACQGSG